MPRVGPRRSGRHEKRVRLMEGLRRASLRRMEACPTSHARAVALAAPARAAAASTHAAACRATSAAGRLRRRPTGAACTADAEPAAAAPRPGFLCSCDPDGPINVVRCCCFGKPRQPREKRAVKRFPAEVQKRSGEIDPTQPKRANTDRKARSRRQVRYVAHA